MIVLQALSMLFSMIIVLIILRIVISWMPALGNNYVARFIVMLTRPLFDAGKRIKILKFGPVDFWPIFLLLFFSTVLNFLQEWRHDGPISLLYLPLLFISISLNIGSFCTLALLVLMFLRLILLSFPPLERVTRFVDQLVQPVIRHVFRILKISEGMHYGWQLTCCIVLMAVVTIALRLSSAWILLR